jgi:hypothetical protein
MLVALGIAGALVGIVGLLTLGFGYGLPQLVPYPFAQHRVETFPRAILAPASEIPEYRTIRRKIMR